MTFTLTGTFQHQDGVTPVSGSLIQVKSAPYPDSALKVYYTRGKRFSTDANGQISIPLIYRSGLYYTIRSLAKHPLFQPITFLAPTDGTTVDITALTSYDPTGSVPNVYTDTIAARNAAIAAAASVAVSTWQPLTAVVANQVVKAPSPDGSEISSNSSRTTRASFDATEQTFWTPVVTKATTMAQVALSKSYNAAANQTVNVKHPTYGATGNGTTDDTTAIAAALAAAKAAGRTLYFPAGTYKITSNQSIDWDYATVVGDGKNTILAFVGCSLIVDGTASYRIGTTLRDLRLTRTGTAGPVLLIKGAGGTTGAARFTLDNIDVKASTGDGMEIAGSFIGTITGSYFRECVGRGVYLHKDPGTGSNKVNALLFHGGEIQANTGGGLEIADDCRGVAFFGTCFENNGTFGARVNTAAATSFLGCYFESNNVADLLVGDTAAVSSLLVEGCTIDNGATGKTRALNLVRGSGITVNGNTFWSYTSNPPISVNEATAGAVIGSAANNTHDGTATSNVALNGAVKFIGITEPAVAYVPTNSGITVGNGSVSGHYTRVGNFIEFYAWFVLGSTSAVTGNITLGLPVTALARAANYGYGNADIFDTSAGATFDARWIATTSTTATVKLPAATSNAALVNTTASLPMAWGTGDVVTLSGRYEAA